MTKSSHIIFVPGMKPKPPANLHRQALLRVLQAGLARVRPDANGIVLSDEFHFSLVAWTRRFYGIDRDMDLDRPGIDRLLLQPEATSEDIYEIESSARRLEGALLRIGDAVPVLRRLIARRALRMTLAEVRRYFDDDEGIATEIRGMVKAALLDAWRSGDRVLLLAHSLGTVIAYDSLWELAREHPERGAPSIDLFVTLGSPLATRFIRKNLRGASCRGVARYPDNIRQWINFSAVGETTALRRIVPYFSPMGRLGLVELIEEHTDLYNHYRDAGGLNVHMAYGYLVHRKLAACIADWLLLG